MFCTLTHIYDSIHKYCLLGFKTTSALYQTTEILPFVKECWEIVFIHNCFHFGWSHYFIFYYVKVKSYINCQNITRTLIFLSTLICPSIFFMIIILHRFEDNFYHVCHSLFLFSSHIAAGNSYMSDFFVFNFSEKKNS